MAESTAEVALVWILLPVFGAGAGWLLKLLVDWLGSMRWVPLRKVFKLVASLDEPQATIGALALGALAGLVFAVIAAGERLTVTVTDDAVTLRRPDSERHVERVRISAVFLDGKQLVLLGPDTEEVVREKSDLPAGRLRDAFVGLGYPWRADGDPHRDEYRRWVEGIPGLPTGAEPLFKARQRALSKSDKADAAELRAELARLGLVVRDEKDRQYWRRAGPSRDLAGPSTDAEGPARDRDREAG